MIHAYHVIFGAYGFWLPNDPRGSWSEFVGAWELVRFGRATRALERLELTPKQEEQRRQAKESLKYPPVQFSGIQARGIGRGFSNGIARSRFTIWACSILPEHIHLVIARHKYKVEHVANQLKGDATKQLKKERLHPLASHVTADGQIRTPWARGEWKAYLDSEEAIEDAIRYVEENPIKEGKPKQTWTCVRKFYGLDKAWTTYH
jgi:REP-associated tyrosine transposase